MYLEYRNIYRKARDATRYTQEGWAEALGVSVDAVKKYENGSMMPSDDVLLTMAIVSNQNYLPFEHLRMKSSIAAKILPDIGEQVSLPKAVLTLMIVLEDMQKKWIPTLMRMAADGKITEDEALQFEECTLQMNKLTRCLYEVKYAKEDP